MCLHENLWLDDSAQLTAEYCERLLPGETVACAGRGRGWQDKNVSYIIEFEQHFKNPQIIKLNLNYRSHQNVVGASNEVIRHPTEICG